MNGAYTGRAALISLAASTALVASSAALVDERPIDRWLVAEAELPAAASPAGDSSLAALLRTDFLSAPGEPGVLPDRGLPAAGVTWQLVRRDGEASVSLDSILPRTAPGTVVYAHAYVRLPADRTLRLSWRGHGCTGGRAWLNGREVAGNDVAARLGAGWNTLLLKLVAGDCPFGYSAHFGTMAGTGEADLGQVHVQASRPPGDVRTGPDDWVAAADTARIAEQLRWAGERLLAGVAIELTAWGRAPVADVEVELRGGPEGRAVAPWLVPGDRAEVVVPVRLDRIERVLRDGVVEARLHWGERERDVRLNVTGAPPRSAERVALEGWDVRPAASAGRRGSGLPTASGWVLEGTWKVPEELAGRVLRLSTAGAPADVTINGSAAPSSDGRVTLCSPCSKGVRLELRLTSTGAWTSMPEVRVGTAGDT